MNTWIDKKNIALNLMVVEDNPAHARLVEKNLRRVIPLEWKIILCPEGSALFAQLKTMPLENNPVCVLLDMNLPDMTGTEVLKRIRLDARTAHIPVCVITSSNNPAEVAQCYTLGCSYYFSKNENGDFFHEGLPDLVCVLKTMCWPLWQPESQEGEKKP